MNKVPSDMVKGVIHSTNNNGDLEIVEYKRGNSVLVKFIHTGTLTQASSGKIRSGQVKDPNKPSVLGVGFVGVGRFNSVGSKYNTKRYRTWKAMIYRCYSPKSLEINPSYTDCTVSPEWHNFQNFAKWFDENYPNDGAPYHLDKDIKIKGNREYGPKSCMFVKPDVNTAEGTCKSYVVKSPDGEVFSVTNMAKFCREKGISKSAMSQICKGLIKQNKGWSARYA